MSDISSLTLCPINFKLFDVINTKLNNIEATLLYSKLKFHQTNSKIQKLGKTCIIRSREQISAWFNFSLNKTDRLLKYLESQSMIEKKAGLWYGKKRLYISTNTDIPLSPINFKILESVLDQTECLKTALIFAKIAFAYANTKIQHDELSWCTIKKETLSTWSGISIRSIDNILQTLIKKGLILKKNYIYKDKMQSHYHIPLHTIKSLQINTHQEPKKDSNDDYKVSFIAKNSSEIETTPFDKLLTPQQENNSAKKVINNQICRSQPANLGVSIRIRSKEKKTNNTTSKPLPIETTKQSDITFQKIGVNLTERQNKYLKSAFNRTIEKNKHKITHPKELWEEVNFSILNQAQRQEISSFQHGVSRFMKIINDGNWKTPIGFLNHSTVGDLRKTTQEQKLNLWQQQKEQECQQATSRYQGLTQTVNIFLNPIKPESLTAEALKIANQMKYLTKNTSSPLTITTYMESLTKQLQGLVRQGADREQVLSCLRI